MNFEWNEEQRLWQQTVRDFSQTEIAPRVREIDQQERIPREIIKGMGR
ncbi:MAG TPA: acyl-CoA dehydrogenase family protein, partial [Anaerolineae bacterium]|nr:acyl-CoA dehydrogenase family protein [Anaerolineae bacterium]